MNKANGVEVVNTTDTDKDTAPVVTAKMVRTTKRKSRYYVCHLCGKILTQSNTLSYHLKVHKGEYPFKCKHCDKAFRAKHRLMKHLETHSISPDPQDSENREASAAVLETTETTTTDLAATAAKTAAAIAAALWAAKTYSKNLNQRLERDCQIDQAKRAKMTPDLRISLHRKASAAVAAIAAKTAAAIADLLLTVNDPDSLK